MPGVDPHVEGEVTDVLPQLAQRGLHFPMHVEGDEHGADGVVLVTHRSAEESQQRIPRKLVDVALIPTDHPAEPADDGIDDLTELFGIETVGQRRKSGDVGEERLDQAALLSQAAASFDQPVWLSTKFRSAAVRSGLGSGRAAASALAPHWPQKRVPSGLSPPHDWQRHPGLTIGHVSLRWVTVAAD